MAGLYRSPLRIYLALAILSLIGLFSAFGLPVSLFPNSAKPSARICVGNDLSPSSFLRTYGESIESQLKSIHRGSLAVEKITSTYSHKDACYNVDFKWGGEPDEAERELNQAVATIQARLPQEMRDRTSWWTNQDNGGFFAASFFSNERSLTETYKILEPLIMPRILRVQDAKDPGLYNPQSRQVLIELKPEQLASFQLLPSQVAVAVMAASEGYSAGSITMDSSNVIIDFPRGTDKLEEFRLIQIPTAAGRSVTLGDLAHIDLTVPITSTRIFKTSGAASVILEATPKPGGNIKAMAEEIKAVINEVLPNLPKDIQYRILVDPSEFIQSAVHNVAKEVALAAGLAVLVLFFFVGNIKNVATAAIEIPLSLVLAFILMKLSGMNLNLISLGGLALSAGMNVDASVVVMENIFRHFEEHARNHAGDKMTFDERLHIIVSAVKEVQFAVIASTIASLVVFIPLAFTSELSYAILGDLAKAVVFSHGFSAIVALILVPTIRLHIMKNGFTHEKPSALEGSLKRLENLYGRALAGFLELPKLRLGVMAALSVLFVLLTTVVAPHLPREVIGKPDTDMLMFGINTSGNTVIRQMEAQTEEIESRLLREFGDKVLYTFSQVRVDSSWIMMRLRDKHDMQPLWKILEEKFPNTPLQTYWVDSWNPSELPLPDPPDFEVSIRGTDREEMAQTARDFRVEIQERKLFNRVNSEPNNAREDMIRIRPRVELWPALAAQGIQLSQGDLADLTRVATIGRTVMKTELDGETMDVVLRYPQSYVGNPEELAALPVGAGGRILPFKALVQITQEPKMAAIRRENGRDAYKIWARGERGEEQKTLEKAEQAKQLVRDWPKIQAERKAIREALKNAEHGTSSGMTRASTSQATIDAARASVNAEAVKSPPPVIEIEDAKVELNDALKQLAFAVSLSIGLIFLTMVFQFGSVMNSLLVLVAVPLGFIGVVISLFVFKSTLSLNSMLGVILLNGLSVANSIILVDFLQRKVKEGVAPRLAAVEVARVRLRPILMTSLTTGLGMLPVALGIGEGGKILQPLGIAVAGGLGFSMITTLFIVPALQVSWLEYQARKKSALHV